MANEGHVAAPTDIPANLFEQIASSDEVKQIIATIESRLGQRQLIVDEVDVLDDGYIDKDSIDSMVVTHVNCKEGLPEQGVKVEYLKAAQKMALPGILGMQWDTTVAGWCNTNATLLTRYHKLTTCTYAELKQLVRDNRSLVTLRAAIDALVMPAVPENNQPRQRYEAWLHNEFYMETTNMIDDDQNVINTFTVISQAAQMNCDVRDFGFLNLVSSCKTDSAWSNIENVDEDMLLIRLEPYTLQSIAALNYKAVGSVALAAWVRAYGVGLGILPHQQSKCVKEYYFNVKMPAADVQRAVFQWSMTYERNMAELCCNILAMFGLFHLNKDHTYRSGDEAMDCTQTSYIDMLRTCTYQATMDLMHGNREAIVHTGPHPFGLAQPYWLALVMKKFNKLASLLVVRVDTTPPPVQRLMMVNAILREWSSLRAGKALNGIFEAELRTIVESVKVVRERPPWYSSLFRLYGLDKQEFLPDDTVNAIAALIPPVYGYVMCTHVTNNNVKTGPACAQMWANIEREQNVIMLMWKNMWKRYFSEMETMSTMIDFARKGGGRIC